MIDEALNYHRQGRLADAERAYRAVLQQQPRLHEALHYLGILKLQQGNAAEAVDLIERALQSRPGAPDAMVNLCNALMRLGRHLDALATYDRLFADMPGNIDALYGRGNALTHLRRFSESLASYDQVLALRADHAGAHFGRGTMLAAHNRDEEALASFDRALALDARMLHAVQNRANVLGRLGRHAEAVAAFKTVLAAMPNNLESQTGMSIALRSLGQPDEALALADRVLAVNPRYHAAILARGNALVALDRPQEAMATFDSALQAEPGNVSLLTNRALALIALNRPQEALESCDAALAFDPNHAPALNNRGLALTVLGNHEAAVESYLSALAIVPKHVDTLNNCAQSLSTLGRLQEAEALSERALAVDPEHPIALATLAAAQLSACNWEGIERLRPKLVRVVENRKWTASPFLLLQMFDDPALQREAARQYARRISKPSEPIWNAGLSRDGKIRVAYLSAHFRRHPSSYLMAELFERHDREKFEILAMSYGLDDGSDIRARLVKAFDDFHDVSSHNNVEAAVLLRDLGVHIAVDLTGYTENGRPGILALRPAPIQVSYMGYAGTMGAPFIDYIVADEVVLPPAHEEYFDEDVVRLPDSYWVVDTTAPPSSPPSRAVAGLPETGFVFCSFNNNWKITEPFFDVWMRLLAGVEGSVLWLLLGNDTAPDNLRAAAQARGIDPSRILFAPRAHHADHMARHGLADLCLDTLPCNAHTTASNSLWAGVPVVTCRGNGFLGRVAESQLRAVGLPELVTGSLSEYEALALRLATDAGALKAIRDRLAQNRSTCALFDTPRFTCHLETAYTEMWARWRRGEAPGRFDVAPLAR